MKLIRKYILTGCCGVAFFLNTANCSEFHIDKVKLEQKLKDPLPQWLERQIQSELLPFKKSGISHRMLDRAMSASKAQIKKSNLNLVRFGIQNNQLVNKDLALFEKNERVVEFTKCMRAILQHIRIPDVDFILSLADSIDSPQFLKLIKVPVFTICKKKNIAKTVLIPSKLLNLSQEDLLLQECFKYRELHPWETKIEKLFWRGLASGKGYEKAVNPRLNIVKMSKRNSYIIDASFRGEIVMDKPKVQKQISRKFPSEPYAGIIDYFSYKYIAAIDGNAAPSSLSWKLASNSIVLKCHSEYIEWYYPELIPFVHFVPYSSNYSDFLERVRWVRYNDAQARQIAENAAEFVDEVLSNESIVAYVYRLLSEYSKHQKL